MTGMLLTKQNVSLTNITMLSRFPARFFSLAISFPQTCEPNLDNAPSKLLGRLVAMPVQSFPNIFRMIAAR